MAKKIAIERVVEYMQGLQKRICEALVQEDGGGSFIEDKWERPEGGGGLTSVLKEGNVFEKAGVNFSYVQGGKLPEAATAQRPELVGATFQATGVSVVCHPGNPYVPTSHANIRFFVAQSPGKEPVTWFGGGFDLTPYYGFESDAEHFHAIAQEACASHGEGLYERFKAWADDYFYLKHRGESRGIGGLFFDDFNTGDFEKDFAFVRDVGESYLRAYLPIVGKRKSMRYGNRERNFQLYRRGRYVEFNLLYDRGTLFGLESGGRTESILMSLPPAVNWIYNWEPLPGTPEAQLYENFLKPRNWVKETPVVC